MKTTTVDERLYAALEAEATRSGRAIHELVGEAIESWLAESQLDVEEHDLIENARLEAREKGGVESEAFFSELLQDQD